jgi:hypothetical protein
MLHAFDAPVMEVNCERRQSSTVATQSLMLMNSQFMLDQAARFAARLQKEAGDEKSRQVARAWSLAFSRSPTASELAESLAFLGQQMDYVKGIEEKKDAKGKVIPRTAPELQALTNFCQSLLSANEFLYID